jgi:RNA polymerase sigma factor (sigma-70 family)
MSREISTTILAEAERAAGVSKGGSRAAEEQFDRIMRDHGAAIGRLAASYEASSGSREELAQEIALAIWQALPNFRGECSERTFIYRIAHNRALTHVWRRRPSHEPLEDLSEQQHPVDPQPRPDEQAAQKGRRASLMSAIQSLPVAHRQVLLLTLEELSQAEIAEVLGITETNVAVRLNRARKALKEAMEGRL